MSSWKKALYSEGSMKEAIHNSIMGFTKCKNVNYTNETQFSIKLLDGDPYIVTSYECSTIFCWILDRVY